MAEIPSARDRLLAAARQLFWARGYANVSVRELAGAAEVDIALISRYFGGKRGLFQATLTDAFADIELPACGAEALVDHAVRLFVEAPRDGVTPSLLQMMLMNAHDADVGAEVRALHGDRLQKRLERLIGAPDRAALFMAALLGLSVAEKSLRLAGIARPGTAEYEAQLRHMMQAALSYRHDSRD
ncbi:MAG: TetR family transcriptional regulator [Pseudomonadota bacterium]